MIMILLKERLIENILLKNIIRQEFGGGGHILGEKRGGLGKRGNGGKWEGRGKVGWEHWNLVGALSTWKRGYLMFKIGRHIKCPLSLRWSGSGSGSS